MSQQVYYTVIPEMFGNVNCYLFINGFRQFFGTVGRMDIADAQVKAQYPLATFVSSDEFDMKCRQGQESR